MWESRSSKSAVFAFLGALNFVDLVNFSLQKLQKFINFKIQRIKRLYISQLWFHVKSDWQKKSVISTLWFSELVRRKKYPDLISRNFLLPFHLGHFFLSEPWILAFLGCGQRPPISNLSLNPPAFLKFFISLALPTLDTIQSESWKWCIVKKYGQFSNFFGFLPVITAWEILFPYFNTFAKRRRHGNRWKCKKFVKSFPFLDFDLFFDCVLKSCKIM